MTGEDREPPLGAGFGVEVTTTAAVYRLFALTGTTPPEPGLVRNGAVDITHHGGWRAYLAAR